MHFFSFQGAASLIQTIAEAKKDAVEPILEAKKSLLESEIVETALNAKAALVSNIAAAGPQITVALSGVVEAVAEAAPNIIKSGLCNVVCPLTGQEQCKKEHCEEKESTGSISPREAEDPEIIQETS